ncbi:MAG: hypothetical protein CMJ49_10955 [Planctomycetaceae bacterium]|nr:hypothetical protein [Planctomycetaceae bacterium]
MPGSLNDILPEPISEANERVILDLLKRKMKGAAGLGVQLLHAMEQRFGPEARQVVRDMADDRRSTPRPDPGQPAADLHEFCARLDRGCVGSHQWQRVSDQPNRIAYEFTRCMWAEIYRELDEPLLGYVICAGDEPAVKSHNPALAFKRTKVLMNGDELCDHVFYVDES